MEMKFFIHDSRKLFLLLLLSVSVTFTACANKKKTPPHVTSSAEKVDLFQLSKNFYNAVNFERPLLGQDMSEASNCSIKSVKTN